MNHGNIEPLQIRRTLILSSVWHHLLGYVAGLFKGSNRLGRQWLQFLEERIIMGFEIETSLTMHVRFQFFRHAALQSGVPANPHEMITDVPFANLNPGNR